MFYYISICTLGHVLNHNLDVILSYRDLNTTLKSQGHQRLRVSGCKPYRHIDRKGNGCTSEGMNSGSDLSLKSPMLRSASLMACRSAGDSNESSGLVALNVTSSASLRFLASRLKQHCSMLQAHKQCKTRKVYAMRRFSSAVRRGWWIGQMCPGLLREYKQCLSATCADSDSISRPPGSLQTCQELVCVSMPRGTDDHELPSSVLLGAAAAAAAWVRHQGGSVAPC